MKIAVTGHRPDKLWGYNLNRPEWQALKWKFEQMLVECECDEALTGMALGVDTVFALAVLNLKKYGRDIKLHCVIPCRNQSARWAEEDKRLYDYILMHADEITYISHSSYRPWLMQRRNEYMVEDCDKILAVYDGHSKGGTRNCIGYAHQRNRDVEIIVPETIAEL